MHWVQLLQVPCRQTHTCHVLYIQLRRVCNLYEKECEFYIGGGGGGGSKNFYDWFPTHKGIAIRKHRHYKTDTCKY